MPRRNRVHPVNQARINVATDKTEYEVGEEVTLSCSLSRAPAKNCQVHVKHSGFDRKKVSFNFTPRSYTGEVTLRATNPVTGEMPQIKAKRDVGTASITQMITIHPAPNVYFPASNTTAIRPQGPHHERESAIVRVEFDKRCGNKLMIYELSCPNFQKPYRVTVSDEQAVYADTEVFFSSSVERSRVIGKTTTQKITLKPVYRCNTKGKTSLDVDVKPVPTLSFDYEKMPVKRKDRMGTRKMLFWEYDPDEPIFPGDTIRLCVKLDSEAPRPYGSTFHVETDLVDRPFPKFTIPAGQKQPAPFPLTIKNSPVRYGIVKLVPEPQGQCKPDTENYGLTIAVEPVPSVLFSEDEPFTPVKDEYAEEERITLNLTLSNAWNRDIYAKIESSAFGGKSYFVTIEKTAEGGQLPVVPVEVELTYGTGDKTSDPGAGQPWLQDIRVTGIGGAQTNSEDVENTPEEHPQHNIVRVRVRHDPASPTDSPVQPCPAGTTLAPIGTPCNLHRLIVIENHGTLAEKQPADRVPGGRFEVVAELPTPDRTDPVHNAPNPGPANVPPTSRGDRPQLPAHNPNDTQNISQQQRGGDWGIVTGEDNEPHLVPNGGSIEMIAQFKGDHKVEGDDKRFHGTIVEFEVDTGPRDYRYFCNFDQEYFGETRKHPILAIFELADNGQWVPLPDQTISPKNVRPEAEGGDVLFETEVFQPPWRLAQSEDWSGDDDESFADYRGRQKRKMTEGKADLVKRHIPFRDLWAIIHDAFTKGPPIRRYQVQLLSCGVALPPTAADEQGAVDGFQDASAQQDIIDEARQDDDPRPILKTFIDVYPSDEYCLHWELKPLPGISGGMAGDFLDREGNMKAKSTGDEGGVEQSGWSWSDTTTDVSKQYGKDAAHAYSGDIEVDYRSGEQIDLTSSVHTSKKSLRDETRLANELSNARRKASSQPPRQYMEKETSFVFHPMKFGASSKRIGQSWEAGDSGSAPSEQFEKGQADEAEDALDQAQKWTSLGIPKAFRERVIIQLSRNGKQDDMFDGVRDVAASIAALWMAFDAIKSWFDFVPAIGFSFSLEAGFMEGAFNYRWGWKEYRDRRVFAWRQLDANIMIARLSLVFNLGARWHLMFLKWELVIYLRLTLQLDWEKSWERQRPGHKMEDNSAWFGASGKFEAGISLILVHEHVCSANPRLKTGIEMKCRWDPMDDGSGGLEYQLYYLGVVIEAEATIVGYKKQMKPKWISRGSPPGLPWKRGIWLKKGQAIVWADIRTDIENIYGRILYHKDRLETAQQSLIAAMVEAARTTDAHQQTITNAQPDPTTVVWPSATLDPAQWLQGWKTIVGHSLGNETANVDKYGRMRFGKELLRTALRQAINGIHLLMTQISNRIDSAQTNMDAVRDKMFELNQDEDASQEMEPNEALRRADRWRRRTKTLKSQRLEDFVNGTELVPSVESMISDVEGACKQLQHYHTKRSHWPPPA